MTKSELVEKLVQAEGITVLSAGDVVAAVIRSMEDALVRGDRVEVRGFIV